MLCKHFVSKAELFAAVLAKRIPLDPPPRPFGPLGGAGRPAGEPVRPRPLRDQPPDPGRLPRRPGAPGAAWHAGRPRRRNRKRWRGICAPSRYLGRIASAADPEALASSLLGACLREVFRAAFAPTQGSPQERADRLMDTFLPAPHTDQPTFRALDARFTPAR
ncbi:hypothetical protein [Streptomyces sp. NBC_01618]|uniref:hypothetical protein n=1 Tax=Streptomyces sp. NBC_01618 TaxID=2975900 RepID=UPI00386EB850